MNTREKRNLSVPVTESTFSKSYWRSAIAEFGDVKKLCLAAILAALSVVLQYLSVPLTQGLYVQVTFTVSALAGAVLGPILSLVRGAVSDIVGFLFNPQGGFYFGYTLSAALSASIYSFFFWHKKITLPRILAAKAIVNVFCNALLGSLWNVLLVGKQTFGAYFAISLAKNLLLFPIEVLIITLLFRAALPNLAKMKMVPRSNYRLASTKKVLIAAIALAVVLALIAVVYFAKPAFISDFFGKILTSLKNFFKNIFA